MDGTAVGPPRGSRPGLICTATLVGLALVVVSATLVAGTTGSSTATWPAAIAPIAAFVSHDRGLSFKRVVPIHLESDARFDAQVASQDVPENAGQRADDLRYQEELVALGLLGGKVNLVQAQTSADASGDVDGYYDPGPRAVYIRGARLDPEVQVTIAHELTHALQDQYFGLDRLDNLENTDGEAAAITALEEGDAVLDEDDYLGSLSAKEQRQDATEEGTGGGGGGGASPPILEVTSDAPYVLGPDFVQALYAHGGNAAINAAFEHPPTTELDELDATAYLRGLHPIKVPPPMLGAGERREGAPDDFGAFLLYLTLAARIDPQTALRAAQGWGGGTFVQYTTAGHSCLRADLVGRTAVTTAAIATAASAWAAAMPAGAASAQPLGDVVRLDACDLGAAAKAGPGSLEGAMKLADQRNQVAIAVLYGGGSPALAACVGDASISRPALRRAVANESADGASASPSVRRSINAMAETCRRSGA